MPILCRSREGARISPGRAHVLPLYVRCRSQTAGCTGELIMSRKSLRIGPCLFTLSIAAFVALSPDAEAQIRLQRRDAGWSYNSDAAGSPYAPYTPGYDKYARQRYPW